MAKKSLSKKKKAQSYSLGLTTEKEELELRQQRGKNAALIEQLNHRMQQYAEAVSMYALS